MISPTNNIKEKEIEIEIVKITKCKYINILEIIKIIKDMPNFIKTICSFNGLDNLDEIDDIITMEIIKKYNYDSLYEYINKLELSEVINILKQLLLAQLYIFNKSGFLHNDINLGNILIKKSKKNIKLNYKINKYSFNITTKCIPLISDFDRSTIYKQPYITEEYQNTLGDNIFNTFNKCIVLLKNKDEKELIYQKINEKHIDIEKYIGFSKKKLTRSSKQNLTTFYKKNYNYEDYINEESKYMLAFSCMLINLLETNNTSTW